MRIVLCKLSASPTSRAFSIIQATPLCTLQPLCPSPPPAPSNPRGMTRHTAVLVCLDEMSCGGKTINVRRVHRLQPAALSQLPLSASRRYIFIHSRTRTCTKDVAKKVLFFFWYVGVGFIVFSFVQTLKCLNILTRV